MFQYLSGKTQRCRSFFLAFILLLPACFSFGQKARDFDLIQLCDTVSRQYPKEGYMALHIQEDYELKVRRSPEGKPVVIAEGKIVTEYAALKDYASASFFDFYSSFSEIKSFRLSKERERKYLSDVAADKSYISEDYFYDDNRIKYFNYTFSKKADRIFTEITKVYKDVRYFTRLYFHEHYPSASHTISITVPEEVTLQIHEMNFDGYKISKDSINDRSEYTITYSLDDIAPLSDDKNQLPIGYTYPHLIFSVSNFKHNKDDITVLKQPADLYAWYQSLYQKTGNKTDVLQSKVDELVKGKTDEVEKAKAIYYWVQDNIRYVAFEDGMAGFIPESVQDVYGKKYGDCKGMANLLTEMLKMAGLDAHITWIGTKHLPYDHSLAALCVDNHCIATLFLNGQKYFLDATNKYLPFGENSSHLAGKEAMIEKGTTFELAKVPETGANNATRNFKLSLEKDKVTGHASITLHGELRTTMQQLYHNTPADKREKLLQRFLVEDMSNTVVSNIKTSDLKNRELPLTIEADISIKNKVFNSGNECYVSLDNNYAALTDYMPAEDRKKELDLDYKYTVEQTLELTLPNGWKAKELPANTVCGSGDYKFQGGYSVENDKLILKKSLVVNKDFIDVAEFSQWKAFLKQVKGFSSNQITLSVN